MGQGECPLCALDVGRTADGECPCGHRLEGGCPRLTEPERKAVVMALRARMRTEAGTFYELLRRAVDKLTVGAEPEHTPRGQSAT